MSQEIENPQEVAFDGETSRGSEKIEALPSRVERYSKARTHAIEFQGFLQESGEWELASRLYGCGNWLKFHHYWTVDIVRLVKASFCKKHLICELCAIRRGAKQLKCYLDRWEVIHQEHPDLVPYLVTLTVKNGEDLRERFDHLMASVKILNQRRRNSSRGKNINSEWSKVLGLVGTYEATNKEKGWHPHTHAIVLCRSEIDSDALSKEWNQITGDSHIVDVRPLQHPEDPAKDFVEVFKYAVKFSSLGHEKTLQAYKALKTRRLIYSQGLFRGVKVPEDLTETPLDDLPFYELFYQYLPGAGYSLNLSKSRLS